MSSLILDTVQFSGLFYSVQFCDSTFVFGTNQSHSISFPPYSKGLIRRTGHMATIVASQLSTVCPATIHYHLCCNRPFGWDPTPCKVVAKIWIVNSSPKFDPKKNHLVGGFDPSEKYLSMGRIIPTIWRKTTSESYFHMISGQNDLLLTMDMAKVGGPLSVVKVCTSMLCERIGYR